MIMAMKMTIQPQNRIKTVLKNQKQIMMIKMIMTTEKILMMQTF